MTLSVSSPGYSNITLSDERVIKLLSEDKSGALYMGPWDKLRDRFRPEKKADVLAALWDFMHPQDAPAMAGASEQVATYNRASEAFNRLASLCETKVTPRRTVLVDGVTVQVTFSLGEQKVALYQFTAAPSFSGSGGPDLRVADLTGADFGESDLSRADLSWADLSGAHLSGANLAEAILAGADLTVATLTGATLTGADLRWADLSWANLTGADLSKARLSGTDLRRTNLMKANLLGAEMTDAIIRTRYSSYANENFGSEYAQVPNFAGAIMPDGTTFSGIFVGNLVSSAPYDGDV